MNHAQKLLQLEEQKQALLKSSTEEIYNHYFCFINLEPIHYISSKNPKGVEKYITSLDFEIITVFKEDKHEFNSFVFNTRIELDNKEKIEKMNEYYEKLQDPYDDWAIPSLKLRNVIGYVKTSNTALPVKDFAKEINKSVDKIVEQHLSKILIEKTKIRFEKTEKFYELTLEEKKSLSSYIKTHLISAIKTSS